MKFQFHKGTIRTVIDSITVFFFDSHFNSIKVQLERRFFAADFRNQRYFNSIKVQLEHNELSVCQSVNDIFQFHKGTIRTPESFR